MARYHLTDPSDIDRLNKRLALLASKGATIDVVAKSGNQRSSQQNRYLHAILAFVSDETGYTPAQVKMDIFKKMANWELFAQLVENKKGDFVGRLRSSAELTTKEMTIAIERFRNYVAIELNLDIPSAEDICFIEYCEQLEARNQEYTWDNE